MVQLLKMLPLAVTTCLFAAQSGLAANILVRQDNSTSSGNSTTPSNTTSPSNTTAPSSDSSGLPTSPNKPSSNPDDDSGPLGAIGGDSSFDPLSPSAACNATCTPLLIVVGQLFEEAFDHLNDADGNATIAKHLCTEANYTSLVTCLSCEVKDNSSIPVKDAQAIADGWAEGCAEFGIKLQPQSVSGQNGTQNQTGDGKKPGSSVSAFASVGRNVALTVVMMIGASLIL